MKNIKTLRNLVGNIPLILCAAGVLVLDSEKRLLLQKRGDDGNWGIPGGCMEIGERVEETAKREVYEETQLHIDHMKLFNVYSGDEQHHIYPNGDEVYFVNVVFISTAYSGEMVADNIESKELRFFGIDELPMNIAPTNKPFIEDLKMMLANE